MMMRGRKSEDGRNTTTIVVIVAVVLLLLISAIAGFSVLGGDDPASASVTLEPADAPGSDPFTESVAIGPAVELPANVQKINAAFRAKLSSDAATHTLSAVGTEPQLYGGTGDAKVCDPQKLIAFLAANPAKAAAWAAVLGIKPANIKTYVEALTPVVLTSDTLVTNHGFKDGAATSLQSVLQAGTAVLVDSTGTPRVKCNCGNPLTPANPISVVDAKIVGTPWTGYDANAVTTVKPGKTTDTLTLVDTRTGDNVQRAVGGGGTSGFVAMASSAPFGTGTTTVLTSSDGQSWTATGTIPNATIAGLAYGNGKWIAVSGPDYDAANFASDPGPMPTRVLESRDLKKWTDVTTLSGPRAKGLTYGNGQFTLVQGDFTTFPARSYTSKDGKTWAQHDVEGPLFDEVAFGNGTLLAAADGSAGCCYNTRVLTSSNGASWSQDQGVIVMRLRTYSMAFGNGTWLMGGTGVDGSDGNLQSSRNTRLWEPVADESINAAPIRGLAFGGGKWVAATGDAGSTFFTSTDTKVWSPAGTADDTVTAVAYGSVGSSSSAPSETTTTVASGATGDITKVDFKNFTYKDEACATGKMQKFVNGEWAPANTFNCGESIDSIAYGDLTGDGQQEAVVTIVGSRGGTALSEFRKSYVYSMTASGPKLIGDLDGRAFPPYSAAAGIETWSRNLGPGDPTCCPSSFDVVTWKYVNGTFAEAGTRNVPADQYPEGNG